MASKNDCVFCGFPVGKGGDRHKKGHCPPMPKPGKNRFSRKRAIARKKREGMVHVVRGMPVAGTGKPAASSPGRGVKI